MTIYKACDIRGQFGTELNIEHAQRLGYALFRILGPATILVGGDGRVSTPQLKQELVSTLLRCGCDVVDLGSVSTPMFYFAQRALSIETGVMVTASYNPAEDNGFKLTLGPHPITEEEMKTVSGIMESGDEPPFPSVPGTCRFVDLLPAYLDFVNPHIPDLSGLRIVVDCANGMASLAAPSAWASTGAQVTCMLDVVDGRFPAHSPNPAEVKNLKALQEQVLATGADLGVAYDGDGDRVTFVDERGQPVTGDKTIVLFAQSVLSDGPQTIIYDQKCSRIVPERVRSLGGTPVVERSGHTYMKRAFLEREAAYAGELSGHHFLRLCGGDDALISSLYFALILRNCGKTLSQLTDEIPTYPITPDLRIPMSAEMIVQVISRLEDELRGEASLSNLDGLRVEWEDGWGLIRPSVTEPVLTLRFEGVDDAALQRILRRVEAIIPGLREKITG